ncbi:MAG TPA: hypothetical protein VNQ55_02620 [Parapedobacter sp.]|nr:hypothetical protein [Parapedobacter sp.]
MHQNIHVSGAGDARSNDFSIRDDSQTTNHIYLHPGPNQGEFDNWMRRIGSLLQVADEHTALKPALELITAVFEPQRLFLITHSALPEMDVEAYTEILVVLDRSQITSKKITKHILNLASFRQQRVVVNFETAAKFERAISQGQPHHCLFCSEENLVFSGSPYRLQSPPTETLNALKADLPEKLEQLFAQSSVFWSEAERLKSQSSNLAALMLHHCLGYLYKNLLFIFNFEFPKTHRLERLQPKVARCFPQVSAALNERIADLLDFTYGSIMGLHFDVNEICDAESVFEEVDNALKVAKAVIEKRTELLVGGSGNLEQSGNSEKTVAKKKSVE